MTEREREELVQAVRQPRGAARVRQVALAHEELLTRMRVLRAWCVAITGEKMLTRVKR